MSNIQVVVRCRERNQREVTAQSQNIVEVPEQYSTSQPTITINPNQTNQLSQQIFHSGDSKTYHFDQVYGPMADQELVFNKAINPLFKDFLNGFNVTVLAYGQTGTGKTFTMCGNTIQNGRIALTETSGVIPRVLGQLFQQLDDNDDDYIIKCSFIELYNENLRDLLNDDDDRNLKIYENKQGMLIQNLKELNINTLDSGFKLLYKGLTKRKMATTKLNDLSSRSHTIFTINLYKKEGDIIKHSKINLVDLAGSENISKSGSMNQRAKEAGSINQSLLTLGRVITSLSEKSINTSHIPYRESKLTRLLQDSLGGKTKTLLISTISPARVNYEETISTLEYSLKVKNIENKPQLGQDFEILMRNVFMKDLSQEIIKLNHDLIATRNKNGIFMDEQNYNKLVDDNMSNKNEISELKSKLRLYEKNIDSLRQDLKCKEEQKSQLVEDINHLHRSESDMSHRLSSMNSQINDSIKLIESLCSQEQLIQDTSEESITVVNSIIRNLNLMKYNFNNNFNKVTDQIDNSLKELPTILNTLIKSISSGESFNKFKYSQNDINNKLKALNNHFQDYLITYYKNLNINQIIETFYQNSMETKLQELKTGFETELKAVVDSQFNTFTEFTKSNMSKFSNQLLTNDLNKISSESTVWNSQSNELYKQLTTNLNEYQTNLKSSLTDNHDKLVDVSSSIKETLSKSLGPTLSTLSTEFGNSNNHITSQLPTILGHMKQNISLVEGNDEVVKEFGKTNDRSIKNTKSGLKTGSINRSRSSSPNKRDTSNKREKRGRESPEKSGIETESQRPESLEKLEKAHKMEKLDKSRIPLLDKENRIDLKRQKTN